MNPTKIFLLLRKKAKQKKMNLIDFRDEFDKFNSLDTSHRFKNKWEDIQPCLNDKTGETFFDSHYIYHPAWAARVVKEIAPTVHYDISSILHFSTLLSAFIPVKFFDYRPAKISLSNLTSERVDLNNLPFPSGSIESVSCMHTIEHIGLGRYGDKIDPDADLRAFEELKRVVRSGGHLLIVVPLGKPVIRFNAHRIYSFEMIEGIFNREFECREFSFIDDLGRYNINADSKNVKRSEFGCGCFWFIKK